MAGDLDAVVRSRLAVLRSARRVWLFASIGVLGAIVDTGALVLFVELTPLEPVAGKLLAWVAGIAVIFALNERWTFANYGDASLRGLTLRFLRSTVVRVGGLVITLVVLAILYYGFGVWYVLANLLGMGVGFFVNYTFESLYTWRVHAAEAT